MFLSHWITNVHHDVQFSTEKRSILAAGDISQFIPDQEADVAVLEEPEHLTWYYHGKRWTDKFQHVVGVVHTNYLEYVKREKNGKLQAFLLKHVNNWVVRIYCNKVLLYVPSLFSSVFIIKVLRGSEQLSSPKY